MQAKSPWKKRLPILAIACAAVVGAVVLRDAVGFDVLARHSAALLAWRESAPLLAALGFVGVYVVIVALSLPGATLATLAGGYLFGLAGAGLSVTGATIGAVLVFLAARAGFGRDVAKGLESRGGAGARLMAELQENEWSALFIMRLVPVVPFFIANLIPAFVGASTHRFAITTFFGILPATFVFTSIGAGLSGVIASGAEPDLSLIYAPQVLGPILGLAALAALPMVIRHWRKRGMA